VNIPDSSFTDSGRVEPVHAPPAVVAAVTIAVFLISWVGARFFDHAYPSLLEAVISYYTWSWLPPLLALLALFRRDALRVWGLTRAPLTMLGLALLMASPALIGFALSAKPQAVSFNHLALRVLLPGTMEELLYRGFLFGVLFKHARWGFVPAGLIAGLVFGAGHLYQGRDLSSTLGVFAITTLGSFWFGWLFLEWDSLWLPIGLHVLLNLFWEVFTTDSTALGDVSSNVFRGLVIALSIVVTRRSRRDRRVTRANWWINPARG
jgi:uncharacterized protein